MQIHRPVVGAALLAIVASPLIAQKPAEKPVAAKTPAAAELKWGPAPAPFPVGAKMAIVSGDPAKSGIFTAELSFPDQYVVPPHVHPTDETVTVKSGSFWYGMGDTFNEKMLAEMKPGDHGTIPATAAHFAKAKGATVVEVSAVGPFKMTLVKPGSAKPTAK